MKTIVHFFYASQHECFPIDTLPTLSTLHMLALESNVTHIDTSACVCLTVQAFAHNEDLLRWVADVPDEASVADFEACASRLRSITSDMQLHGSGGLDGPTSYSRPLAAEALGILMKLRNSSVSLRLLEATQVSVAVAGLRSHPDPDVASHAQAVTQQWRATAAAALSHATALMGSAAGMGGGGGLSTPLASSQQSHQQHQLLGAGPVSMEF